MTTPLEQLESLNAAVAAATQPLADRIKALEAELTAERNLSATLQDALNAERLAHLATMRERDALRAENAEFGRLADALRQSLADARAALTTPEETKR